MKNKLFLLSVLGLTAFSNYASAQCSNSGIGTPVPGAKLDIRGCGSDSTTAVLKVANSTDTTVNPILFIRNDNRIGLGTKFPQTMLDVNGTIFSRQGFKFPDGTVQSTAAGNGASSWALGSGQNSIINNISGWNVTNGVSSFIGGGDSNTVSVNGLNSIILGGQKNYIGDDNCVILSGTSNNIMDPVIFGGGPHQSYNLISGGSHNTIFPGATNSGIIQGVNNVIEPGVVNSVILGGQNISAHQSNTVYVPQLGFTDGSFQASAGILPNSSASLSSLSISNLSGVGNRVIMTDANGNLVTGGSTSGIPNAWMTNGNQYTHPATDFLGTLDNQDLILKTGNRERIHIMPDDLDPTHPTPLNSGYVSIRTFGGGSTLFTPMHDLHLHSDVQIPLNGDNTMRLAHANCCLIPDNTINFDSLGNRTTPTTDAINPTTSLCTFQITNGVSGISDDNGMLMGMNGNNGFISVMKTATNVAGNLAINSAGAFSLSGTGNGAIATNGFPFMLQTNSSNSNGTYLLMNSTLMRMKINGQFAIVATSNGNVGIGGSLYPASRLQIRGIDGTSNNSALNITTDNEATSLFFVRNDGNVGIGTAIPNYPLDVNGIIRANEVKVCLFGTCDFVFDKNYNLMPVDSLSAYLNENHHLPGIASAKEMEAEGNISLGKMDSQLLQKVEELTLYIVQQQQIIEQQSKEMKRINSLIEKLLK